ncbi:hypothetical protein [Nocardia otitidiscaviarum]|uniref:hypothetical protein n=1 Tax=Nocardia otitidiscaviarum TaxID=1823 RepID=UPI0004A71EC6|nr:hypothetical protein [Nocardia otitidiscaviarum]
MASDRVNSCLYPRRDPDTACGYAHAVRTDDTTEEGPVMASDRDTLAALLDDDVTRQVEVHASYISHLDQHELADAVIARGWRPPARVIETREDLDALGWPCVVREIPADDDLEFYPQIWEKAFQTDHWCRAGHMVDESDCIPQLPVEVLVEPKGDCRG